MGRKSVSEERRAEIEAAFAKVLATHGYAQTTMTAIAAEAIRDPLIMNELRRGLDDQLDWIRTHSTGALGEKESGALLAFVMGSIVFGAFSPKRTQGFAYPSAQVFLKCLSQKSRPHE